MIIRKVSHTPEGVNMHNRMQAKRSLRSGELSCAYDPCGVGQDMRYATLAGLRIRECHFTPHCASPRQVGTSSARGYSYFAPFGADYLFDYSLHKLSFIYRTHIYFNLKFIKSAIIQLSPSKSAQSLVYPHRHLHY